LIADFSAGLEHLQDQATRASIRSLASLSLKIEHLEDQGDRGVPVDPIVLTRLLNTQRRGLERLDRLRRQASEPSAPKGQGGWSTELARHLHWMAWAKCRTGASSYGQVPRDRFPELTAEYEALERQGAFADTVR
jgi:hypothetical protein